MKRQRGTYIDDQVWDDFEKMCEGTMEPGRYLAAMITEFSKLKPEFALKGLGVIPTEWKHRRPGRPTGPATADRKVDEVAVQDVA